MLKSLEHNEHAGHLAHGGTHGADHGGHGDPGGHPAAGGDKGKLCSARIAALLVSGLAAGLAISEQGAKHAEIRVMGRLVEATDAWAQYQAKSIRSATAKDLSMMIGALDPAASADVADRRKRAVAELDADQARYDHRRPRARLGARARPRAGADPRLPQRLRGVRAWDRPRHRVGHHRLARPDRDRRRTGRRRHLLRLRRLSCAGVGQLLSRPRGPRTLTAA